MYGIEKDLTSIDQIVLPFIHALKSLFNMQTAHDMAISLESRFIKICPFQLPLFAFLATKIGLNFYKKHLNENKDVGIPHAFFILAKEILDIPYTGAAVGRLFTF